MHSGPSGYSDLSAPFENEPQSDPPSALRPRFPAFVIAAPAKRITFFKSGDAQFGGVRMAIHHRSFKCFDALLDDLSQKVPLPFGVRTITTPRGTHSIKRLEQLEDGGCYLCSDRRYTKPIDMELAAKRPAMWHHHSRPHSGRRRPVRPDEAAPEHISPHFLRHPKRIVLVKNTDPSVRRSIILSRRTARSLRVFMEEVSELMQCHIKKLYTIEGRKIDSIQSLVHSPNVLVCVGREPFRPLMVECRKNSEEKLPGMGSRSRSSLCSEGHESRKNVNFGLETKKSIIHPRSDSSNRSTRFSLSSEKSYPNGLCTPGQSGYVANCLHPKEAIINDDIEKRVLVNKDGSLSVEMKVRFRLTNDETLQWSTEIKKSPASSNDALHEKEANPHYLHQGKESSEQESSGEVEEVYATKLKQRQVDESRCENCCNHCQEYDIWKNPMHREHHRKARRVKSSSSSTSSHKVVRKEASVDSIRTVSRSSEEYTEHVVEKASCYQQMVGGGDTVVEYCTISRCCSRSEVCSTATTPKSKKAHAERYEGESRMIHSGESRPDTSELKHPHSGMCCVEVTKASDTDDRPVSETSNSSKVLESLKEDPDDDYDDLLPSASRASQCFQGECENEDSSRVKNYSRAQDERLLSPKRRELSPFSVRSLKRRIKNASPTPADQQQNNPMPNKWPESTESRSSSKFHFSHRGALSPQSAASDTPEHAGEDKRPQSTVSKSSRASNKSHRFHKDRSPSPRSAPLNGPYEKGKGREEEEKEERTLSAMSGVSKGSGSSSVCPHCGGCTKDSESASRESGEPPDVIEENEDDVETEEKAPSVKSADSVRSAALEKSVKSTKSPKCDHRVSSRGATPASDMSGVKANGEGETGPNGRAESALSNHSNASAASRKSNRSVCSNCGRLSAADSVVQEQKSESVDNGPVEEERLASSLSNKSRVSQKSDCSTSNRAKTKRSNDSGSPVPSNDDVEGRDGGTSAQSNSSRASRMSRNSEKGEVVQAGSNVPSGEEDPGIDEVVDDKAMDERASSALSNKTDASVKSCKSNCSASNSALSAKSNVSAASRSGRPHSKASERAASPAVSETVSSVLSNKSKASNRSNLSPKQSCSDDEQLPQEENVAEAAVGDTAEEAEEPVESSRAPSAMSNASVRSRTSHRSACSTASRAKSPRAKTTKANELNGNGPIAQNKNTCDSEAETVEEQRAASVMSNKTDTSVRSKASHKLVLPAPERAKSPRPKSPARVKQGEKDNEAEERPASALSVKSDVSRTSRRSKRAASPANPCQNEISSASENRPSSAMSKKSLKSYPKTNETNEEGAHSDTTIKDEIPEPLANSNPAEDEEEKEERAASAMSNKTDTSVMSRTSHKSTRGASEKAQTARVKSPAPSNRVKEDEIEKRPLSSLSVGTDVSRSSRKSKAKEANRSPSPAARQRGGQELEVASEERPISAMSKKSTKSTKIQYKDENDVQERVPSAMSSRTTSSIKSSKSRKASPNADPHFSDTAKAKEAEVRPESSASQTSDRKSFKGVSGTAITQAERTDTPAGQEVKQAAEEVSDRSKSALSVASQSSKKSNRAPSPRPKSSQSKIGKHEEELRASSAMSVNSKVSSKSKKCQCNHAPPKTPESPRSKNDENAEKSSTPDATETTMPDPAEGQEDTDGSATVVTLDPEAASEQNRAGSVRSTRSSTKSKVKKEKDRSPSASSTSSALVTRSKSPAPIRAVETLKDLRPKSSASMRSEKSTKSYTKVPKTNSASKLAGFLDVIVPQTDKDARSENGSVKSTKKAKSVKFDKDPEEETLQDKTSRSNSGATSQSCSSPPQEQPIKNKPPTIRLASTSSDSVLSNALSAADLLRGLSENTRPGSRNSQRNVIFGQKENDRLETKSNRSSKYAHKKIACSQKDEQSSLELVQSCLPNASSTDVVNEWLKNIPIDGPVYQMEDEFNDSEEPQVESGENAEDSIQNDSEHEDAQVSKIEENDTDQCEEKEDMPEETNEDDAAAEGDMTDPCDDVAIQAEECILDTIPSKPKNVCLPKRAQSSVQVMKALLSPKFERCNSLPEVSPVYGRKLSRSAEGLLDCLAKLRLIDSDPANTQNAKYMEIMNILQTLWLYKPTEWDPKTERVKDHPSAEDEANPRSSSGVDVSSGSDESAKSMVNSGVEKVESAPSTVVVEQQPDSEVQEDGTLDAEQAKGEVPADNAPEDGSTEEDVSAPEQVVEDENEEIGSDADTPDVAARVQGSPENSEKSDDADTENVVQQEVAQSAESPKDSEEAVQSPNTSSGKESRSANEMESDRPECSSSGTPPSVKQAQLTSKVSQDPDPTWVLSLLKKIEKQFMTHYANAMAEFKVRWDLDDNVMLDTMINELKVEVQKRIQNSIKRELQKIQGRAGKSPKPPMTDLSQGSSVQTDQRRRRLKVMRNRSLKPSNSNGSDAASGTSFSDQRSDDEYCPCDACMRKKMEARQVIRAEVMNIAPVRLDFDLRKILQVKRDLPAAPKVEAPPPAAQPKCQPEEEQNGNLEVVEEEPEQEEDAPEEADAQAEEEEADEAGERVDSETGDGAEQEEDRDGEEEAAVEETATGEGEEGGEEAEQTNENLNTEEGEDEQTAAGEDAVEEAGEDADEGDTANVNEEGDGEEKDGDNQDAGDDEDAQDEARGEDDAADQQQSKDETEDEAIAENTPMDDTEGDAENNQGDSTDAVDEIQEEGLDEDIDKDEAEEAGDAEGDTTVQNDTGAEENEETEDQEKGDDEAEEDAAVADMKAARGDSWERFRNRQMTRTSVESQPGSMDSMELQLEAKQIVQSVFSSIQGPKRDWDETDEGLKSTSKKRSRSPARANKARRPKDSDIKVDDLEF